MSDLRQRLLAAFQLEQKDHLERLRAFLDALESGTSLSIADYQEAFRSAHTLKGASRAVDLPVLETITHHLESVLLALKEGRMEPTESLTTILRGVLDEVEDYAGSPGVEEREAPHHLIGRLHKVLGESQSNTESVHSELLVRSVPTAVKTGSEEAAARPVGGTPTVRVAASILGSLTQRARELKVEAVRHTESAAGLRALTERLEAIERDWSQLRRSGLSQGLDQTSNLDLQLHQCLSVARGLLVDQTRRNTVLGRLGDSLESQVREARMIPAGDVLGDLGPAARDLARSQGKQLEFRSKGLGILVDRQVLGQIHEPLLHLIRNAVDHGLETPEERVGQGKSPVGRLELELRVTRSQLVTTLSDDGRGIDLDKVRARASALGLESEGGETALLSLLLLPEFTTVATPGKLSGRGLGLSILKGAADRLGGQVLLSRGQPKGTLVGLRTPLSITVQSLLLVRCQGQVFGVPTQSIDRLVRLAPEELAVLNGKSCYLRDGLAIPAVALTEALALPGRGVAVEDGRLCGVLVEHDEKTFLLIVDGLLAQREAIVSALAIPGYSNPKLSGMFSLDDETVCLVLNPSRLWESVVGGGIVATTSGPATTDEAAEGAVTILVVDDSITTRMLERSILETHGYRVVLAVDGEDALRQLKLHQVDLVISDVQMPLMDGFELLTAIKDDPQLCHLPVILLTSCEDRYDRRRGLELGAEAYLSKQSFDQEGLLETVRQIA